MFLLGRLLTVPELFTQRMRLSKAFIVDLIWLLLNSLVEKLDFKVVFEMLLGF